MIVTFAAMVVFVVVVVVVVVEYHRRDYSYFLSSLYYISYVNQVYVDGEKQLPLTEQLLCCHKKTAQKKAPVYHYPVATKQARTLKKSGGVQC